LEVRKMKIGVIMGGISSEREVSLKSGAEICKNLNKEKYEVIPIILDSKEELMDKVKGIDAVFLALHGQFGEDGTVQGILEALNIPYTGCGLLSSAMCMDKDITKRLIKAEGIKTAPWINVKNLDEINYIEIEKMGYPIVAKPNSGGSSVATFIIKDKSEVYSAVKEGLKYDREVMIEKYIKGDEITCCILNGRMLPVLAIKPRSSFFDYTSKYEDGGADEFIVELEENLHRVVEDMSIKCYELLKCSVYARVDLIVQDGEPYVLEINTLPGMTKNSLFPKSARGVGIDFTELLDLIIEYSLKERG
jgi:D-alanine-D-alanine ligase